MLNGSKNEHSIEFFDFEFYKVSNLILYSYNEILKNEKFIYTKLEDNKYWVILENGNKEKPEEYIRNVFLDKKYMLNINLKRKFCVNDLEFKPETGEIKDRQMIGYHDIQVFGIAQKLFGEADEEIYFSIECKRLNKEKQKPGNYVNDGIIRYTNGQYSEKMPIAGMMGFIEDDEYDYPMKINKVLLKHKKIQTEQSLVLINKKRNVFNSIHSRSINSILLYHFMLDITSIIHKQ